VRRTISTISVRRSARSRAGAAGSHRRWELPELVSEAQTPVANTRLGVKVADLHEHALGPLKEALRLPRGRAGAPTRRRTRHDARGFTRNPVTCPCRIFGGKEKGKEGRHGERARDRGPHQRGGGLDHNHHGGYGEFGPELARRGRGPLAPPPAAHRPQGPRSSPGLLGAEPRAAPALMLRPR
jgi:hypothetical protein